MQPLGQFLWLCSAASHDSGKVRFPSGANASGLALSRSTRLFCIHYPRRVSCQRWISNLVLNSGTNKGYWGGCLKEGDEQKPHLLQGKINNSLAVTWKEARPMRDTKLRIPAARVRTGTKLCLCHLQSAFPQPMNWIFVLPTPQRQSVNAPFCFFGVLKRLKKVHLMPVI